MKTCRTQFTALITALLLGLAGQLSAAGVQLPGALANIDVRYPDSLPNGFEIVLYGDGLTTSDVVSTWNSNILLGGRGAQWGPASSINASTNADISSSAFGLDCVIVRYAGSPRPAMVGVMVHFGVHLRPGAAVAHSELWWTINGTRVLQPECVQVIWHSTKNGWLIELNNPKISPIYIYGTRFFAPTTSLLPNLNQLNFGMNPAQFGGAWTNLALPGGAQVFAIPAQAHIFLRVPSVPLRAVVFQFAVRNVSAATQPLPAGTTGPNPSDVTFNGSSYVGTITIATTRATEEFAEDLTGDGVVGIPDFNQLRTRFGTSSQDLVPTN